MEDFNWLTLRPLDDKGDFVIVTREGQIAKVVYQAKARWSYKFVDCQMLYVRSPTS